MENIKQYEDLSNAYIFSCLRLTENEYLNPGNVEKTCPTNVSPLKNLIADPIWDFKEVGDNMLYLVKTRVNHEQAIEWCQGLGAQLVEIWTEKEYKDVRYKIYIYIVLPVTNTDNAPPHHLPSP